ncbi:Glucosyltransferase-like protein, partial [Borealophlyctis nickersoniae]
MIPSEGQSNEKAQLRRRIDSTSPTRSTRKTHGAASIYSADFPSVAATYFNALRTTNGAHLALVTIYLFTIFVKSAVGLNGYSGQGVPPVYGDFEAQRHWLEVTVNLPPREWYRYDLKYWGLDYPPLTAYHSWLLGVIARRVNPEWVALVSSRGLESENLKVFMRATALATEYLIYVPAVVLFVNRWVGYKNWVAKNVLILLILLQPALMIIDHGHFQYNSAMLGFALWSIMLLCGGHYVAGSVFFCLSLLFKQMALFYALPVFFYLLGRCFERPRGLLLFFRLGLSVVITFGVCLIPLLGSVDDVLQIFRRIFPVHRGLWEDKVSNVWCALNIAIKLRQLAELQTLLYLSMACTLLAVLPSSIDLLRRPGRRRLIYATVNGALGFFLFSFQVHEKSILLPAMPVSLLLLDEPVWAVWFNNVAMFSMFPLLKRDELVLPYIVTLMLWNWLASFGWTKASRRMKLVIGMSYICMMTVHVLEATVTPPKRLPDIYTVANVELSTLLFGLMFLYFNYRQFTLPSSELEE